jgi:uncharacterized protein
MMTDRSPVLRSTIAKVPLWTAPSVVFAALLAAACGTPDPVPGMPSPGAGAAGGRPSASGGTSFTPGGTSGLVGDGGIIDCGPPPVSTGAFSKRALLTAAADCASYHYCHFEGAAEYLYQQVQRSIDEPSDATLEAARAAWRQAMLVWGRAELFQFGPAGSRAQDPYHGRSFRDRIYSWPSTSRCRVEEQIVGQGYRGGFENVLVTGKGLFALEYLHFYPGSDTACSATSSTGQAWPGLDAGDLAQRKQDYALATAGDVLALARGLRHAWDPDGEDFRQTLIDAVGYDKPGSGSDQEALNIVAWSLVYVEREVKDWKIGPHTRLTLPPAPVDGFETPHARLGRELVIANLEGFRSLYQGCGEDGAGIGFDDWLVSANHADLARDIDRATEGALEGVRAFPPFHEASTAQFTALYDDAIKPLSDLLKNELMAGNGSPLNLSLPASAAGDND